MITRLKTKIDDLVKNSGVDIDEEIQRELEEAVNTNQTTIDALPRTDFRRIFWNQQV